MANITALRNLVTLLEDISSDENINPQERAKYIETFNFLASQVQNRELKLKRIENYQTLYDLYRLVQKNLLLISAELDKPISGNENVAEEADKKKVSRQIVSLVNKNAHSLQKQKKDRQSHSPQPFDSSENLDPNASRPHIHANNPDLAAIMQDQELHDTILEEVLSDSSTDEMSSGLNTLPNTSSDSDDADIPSEEFLNQEPSSKKVERPQKSIEETKSASAAPSSSPSFFPPSSPPPFNPPRPLPSAQPSQADQVASTDVITPGERGPLLSLTNEYMKHLEDEIWDHIWNYRIISGFRNRDDTEKSEYRGITRENAFATQNRKSLNNLIKNTIDVAKFDAKSLTMLNDKYRVMLEIKGAIDTPNTQKSEVMTEERRRILSEHRDNAFTRGMAALFSVLVLVPLPFVWARTGNLFGSLITSRGEQFCHDADKILGSSPTKTPQKSLTR